MISASRLTSLIALLAAALVSVGTACSGDGGSNNNNGVDAADTTEADGMADTDTPSDDEAPEYRDIKASIQGTFSSQVDLRSGDQRRVLPVAAPVQFTVFATDNETGAEDLTVEVVDPDGQPLGAEATFSNGLWKLDLEIAPGDTAYVRTTDEAGNAATSEYALIIPTRAEAVQGNWERLFYNREKAVANRWPVTYAEDGTWEVEQDEGVVGGTYEANEDQLTLTQTFDEAAQDGDTDTNTVEEQRVMSYYVDNTFLMPAPYETEGDDSTVEGTWTRTYDVRKPVDGTLDAYSTATETLEFNEDGTWSWTRVDELEAGGSEETSESGTYTLEISDGYIENYGNYLFIEVTSRDGTELTTAEEDVWLQRFRLGKMLINPNVRVGE
ncbi:MAG: hypothetical protein ACQEVA_06960 [Myxococcota bacterium]